jgi:ribosome-associated heat shock protein Hsp15
VLKPSRLLHEGDVVTATASGRLFVVRVLTWTARRGPASVARTLYKDLTPRVAPSPERQLAAKAPRPTKRDRRRLDALRAENTKA